MRLLVFLLLLPCFAAAQDSNPQHLKPTKYRMSLRLADVSIGTNETQRKYALAHLNRRTDYRLYNNINWAAEPQLNRYPSAFRRDNYSYNHILNHGGSWPDAIIGGLLQWTVDKAFTKKQ